MSVLATPTNVGYCVKTNLGTWLAEAGGGFHPSLFFRNAPEDTSIESANMGMSVFTEQSIGRNEVLASCTIQTIIRRKNGLEAIEKLIQFDLSEDENCSKNPAIDSDPPFKILPLASNWLDRTIISLYLILTRLSIKLKDSRSDGDELNQAPSSPTERTINELFSFHEEYVRLLPRFEDLTTPLFWNRSEVDKLRSTLLYKSVVEQKKLWTDEYETLMKNILEVSPMWHDFLNRHISCDDYFWGCTIVTSRSFSSNLLATSYNFLQIPTPEDVQKSKLQFADPQPILLPGVDIFNHKRGAKDEWRSIRMDSQVQRIELVTWEDQQAPGQQVFINYGPKSSGEFIMGYGFALSDEDVEHQEQGDVIINNPDDFYTVKLSKPKTQNDYSALSSRIFDGLKEQDLNHYIGRDGLIPLTLYAQLRILVISTQEEGDQLDLLCHPGVESGLNSLQCKRLNWFNELNMLDCLISMLKLKLKDLNKFNHASDEPLQWDQVRTPIKRMIQIYRQGQRDILEKALKRLQREFDISLEEAEMDGFHYDSSDDPESDSDESD